MVQPLYFSLVLKLTPFVIGFNSLYTFDINRVRPSSRKYCLFKIKVEGGVENNNNNVTKINRLRPTKASETIEANLPNYEFKGLVSKDTRYCNI
ncbi:MAG: hypothetical protein WAM14_11325 [Candidatus Nitrosopolaris sp.]